MVKCKFKIVKKDNGKYRMNYHIRLLGNDEFNDVIYFDDLPSIFKFMSDLISLN